MPSSQTLVQPARAQLCFLPPYGDALGRRWRNKDSHLLVGQFFEGPCQVTVGVPYVSIAHVGIVVSLAHC